MCNVNIVERRLGDIKNIAEKMKRIAKIYSPASK